MHIAIVNATGGGLSGGYRSYLNAIVPLMSADSRVSRLDLFLPPGMHSLQSVPGALKQGVRTIPVDRFGEIRLKVMSQRPDIVFIPTARWIDFGGIPMVSMVRNMEPLLIPLSPRDPIEVGRNLARRLSARNSCRRSEGIIAVSSFVKAFLVKQWRISNERIAVIHHGVDPLPWGEPSLSSEVQARLGTPFLFTAGSIRPARGLEEAIRAMANLCSENRPITLAIAGAVDARMDGYAHKLIKLANELGCSDNLIWLGAIDRSSMGWAFRNCKMFLMTSHAEACPNTALEAMAHGCLCISTDMQPMPEIFGQTAFYYRAGEYSSLSETLRRALITEDSEVAAMRERARKRAAQFTWASTASATLDFLAAHAGLKTDIGP